MYSANLTILAQQVGVAWILSKSKPRRLITRGGNRVRGSFPSARFPWELTWNTPQERRLFRVAELSYVELRTQPLTLNLATLASGSTSHSRGIAVYAGRDLASYGEFK